ncbi:hypothetical protein HZA33_00815 [Candidatus Pacearchaeota archaeon]|nr:hypothetical protein [Candidatus Pacearchaeota archaeon]
MAPFVYRFSPQWFYGIDIIFEFLSIVASLLIAFYALRLYKFTNKLNHKYFGYSFIAIALSFFIKIMTNLVGYFSYFKEESVKLVTVLYHGFTITYTPVKAALFVHRFLMLAGLFGIFYIVSRSREKNKILLYLYFMTITALYVLFDPYGYNSYRIFYLTTAFMSAFILRYYYLIYKKNKNKKTLLIVESFLFILLGQIVFIFTSVSLNFYVLAEIIQFFGFLLLLYNYYLIRK